MIMWDRPTVFPSPLGGKGRVRGKMNNLVIGTGNGMR